MIKENKEYDVIIIGAGPAGMSAAIYAARGNMSTLVLDGEGCGGQMNFTEAIENYPGYSSILGTELSREMFEHSVKFGAEYEESNVKEVCDEGLLKKVVCSRSEYLAKAVIIASGARHRALGVPGEKEFGGRGVSYCAICDGAFYEGKEVAVIGGGNSAVEEALFLTHFASKVTIIHRRGELRAEKVLQARALKNEKINIIWNSVVKEIYGSKFVEGLYVENTETKEQTQIPVNGAFIYVGMDPSSAFVKNLGITDESGYIVTDEKMRTKKEGVFAAGDVRQKVLRQVVTAANDGCIAAQEAQHYIEQMND